MSKSTEWINNLTDGLAKIFHLRKADISEAHIAQMAASTILYKIIVINGKHTDEKEIFYRFYKSEFHASDEELDSIYTEASKVQGTDAELIKNLNHLLNKHKDVKMQIIRHFNTYEQVKNINPTQKKMFEQAIEILSSFED